MTQDHGAKVVLSTTVPSGLTAMQALERKASVDTAYGGRFVDAIEGIEGNEGAQRSWFYFVNGIEADRGAAEYTVRPGDVIWWDYRSWRGQELRHPVVVGAFPEPFVHGYAGHVRAAVVRYWPKSEEALALGLANEIGARSVEPASVPAPAKANVLRLVDRDAPFSAALSFAGRIRRRSDSRDGLDRGREAPTRAPAARSSSLPGACAVKPAAALALLAALAAVALLADRWQVVAVIAASLLALCLRAPKGRRRPYLAGCLLTAGAVLVVTPFVVVEGSHVLWSGPTVPVLGRLDVTSEELAGAAVQALRLAAVTLAFAVYALLLDHDALLRSARFARRSAFVVALATRLVPTLERDTAGLVEALRGRGVAVEGVRGRARLLSPIVSGSLERAINLAEAMEARGYGRPGSTRVPGPRWKRTDVAALTAAGLLLVVGVMWL